MVLLLVLMEHQKLQQILPKDAWVYLPDIIQDGRSIESLTQAKSIVVGFDQDQFAKMQITELLRPFFPREEQLVFMPILDAEFTKLSTFLACWQHALAL